MNDSGWNRLGRSLKAALQAAGDILWPPVCSVCPRSLTLIDDPLSPAGYFCEECLEKVEFLPPEVCPVCARPLYDSPGGHVCGDCLAEPPAFQRARSAAAYEGPVGLAVSRLKYTGDLSQVAALTALAQRVVRPPDGGLDDDAVISGLGEKYDLIIPMPISRPRLNQRGFNQAAELARSLYRPWRGLINEAVLIRKADNERNSGLAALSADERRRAIRGLFSVTAPEMIKGARVLLFDDVLTTGATAGEAARTLMTAGAASVELVTVARTVLRAWRR